MSKLLIKKVSHQAISEADEAFNILEMISRKLDPNHPAERMTIDVAKVKIEQAQNKIKSSMEWMLALSEE